MRNKGIFIARYRRPFRIDGVPCEVVVWSRMTGLFSELRIAGTLVASDHTPVAGPEAIRNHLLAGRLPDGGPFEVEAGYISWWSVGIAVRRDGAVVHESHPGRRIAMPESAARMARDPALDLGSYRKNVIPISVDIALGLLFFVVAKLTDLSTAAIVGAVAGLALLAAQRFVKVDLVGGLALFGIVMLLLSAALAIIFQDDMAVKMRTTILGLVSAGLFLVDGLFGGSRIGRGLARYIPYRDIDPGRLAIGIGMTGLFAAGLNYVVARYASTDMWLFYTTFVDIFLIFALMLLVIRFARRKPAFLRGRGAPEA